MYGSDQPVESGVKFAPEQRSGSRCRYDEQMANRAPRIEMHWLVDDVMRRWPSTIRVFLNHKMGCVGCPIGTFHGVDDACREHGISPDDFMEALREVTARVPAES
jgi:hybrid cluster-associated redox disulfide protein